jgi:hypothetical protein
MTPPATPERYKHHRFPVEIISHGVSPYYRFCLSYRDVEELLLARGVTVTYEAIRKWCRKFGQLDANQLRRREAGGPAECGAPPAPLPQQPRRELPSACPPAGAADAGV